MKTWPPSLAVDKWFEGRFEWKWLVRTLVRSRFGLVVSGDWALPRPCSSVLPDWNWEVSPSKLDSEIVMSFLSVFGILEFFGIFVVFAVCG